MTVAEEVFAAFELRGVAAYFGERVSMVEHSLQAAFFAREEAASPALIAAALLHDIGHLVDNVPDDIGEWTADAHHEQVGAHWLSQR